MRHGVDTGSEPPTVVVVDDDPAVLGALKFWLEVDGFAVRVFHNGQELLDDGAALPRRGCLVLDYVMPDMNGLDLLDALRSRHVDMPAILITTHPTAALRLRAKAAGVDIIEKPLLGNALTDSIRRAITPTLEAC